MKNSTIDLEEVNRLIAEKVKENNQIEYKLELNISKSKEKKEFLADISSFANTNGGTIYYGIEEKDSFPIAAHGIVIENEDKLRMQVEASIRDGISPSIQGIELVIFNCSSDHFILAIKIPRSPDGLHQVTFEQSGKFFKRGSNSKYMLTSQDIETAVIAKTQLKRQLKEFQDGHLSKLINGTTPVALVNGPKVILQFIPASSITTDEEFPITDDKYNSKELAPLGGGSRSYKVEFDGITIYTMFPYPSASPSYLKIFKNGRIDTVNCTIFSDANKIVKISLLEGYVLREVKSYLDYCQRIKIDPPIYLYLTIHGIQGFLLYSEKAHNFRKLPLETNELRLNPITIADYASDIERQLKAWFDAVWNAFGFDRSFHFDSNGHWIYDTRSIY